MEGEVWMWWRKMIKDDRYTHVTILPLWVIEYQMTKVFCVLFHIIVTFGNRIIDRKYPPL